MEDIAQDIEADFRKRLIANCHSKCVSPAYLMDGELNKGESVCLDRCVSKFMQVNNLVTKVSNEVGAALAQQMGVQPPPQ